MTENTPASSEKANIPKKATDTNHLRKLSTRSSKQYLDTIKSQITDAQAREIASKKIPQPFTVGYEASLEQFIAQHPTYFGYQSSEAVPRDEAEQILLGMKQHVDVFHSDLFDTIRWQEEHREKLIQNIKQTYKKRFEKESSKIPEEVFESKSIQELEKLLKSVPEQRKLWSSYTDETLHDNTPKILQPAIQKLEELLKKTDDKAVAYAHKELTRFTDPDAQSLPPDVFRILFQRDILSDSEIHGFTQWLLPILTTDQLAHVGIPAEAISGYSNPSLRDEDTREAKQNLKRSTLTSIPTEELSVGQKKQILKNYGSQKIVEKMNELIDGPDATSHDEFKNVGQQLGFGADDYSYRTQEGFKKYVQQWNEKSKKQPNTPKAKNIENLQEGSIIQRTVVGPDKKNLIGYYRVINFPDGFIPPQPGMSLNELSEPPGEMVTLQYIGDEKHGVTSHGGSIAHIGHEDFFHFLTGTFNEIPTTGTKIINKNEWNTLTQTEKIKERNPEEHEYVGEKGFAKGIKAITGNEKIESDGIQDGTTLYISEDDGPKSYLSIHSFNPTNNTLVVDNGQERSGLMTVHDFLTHLENLKKKSITVEYFDTHRPDINESLTILKKNNATAEHFKNVSVVGDMFCIGDTEDNSVPLNIFRLNRSRGKGEDGNDIYIKSISSDGIATYSVGEFKQAKKNKDNEEFIPADWTGSKFEKAHISTVAGFIEQMGHKPEVIKESIEPSEFENKDEKPSIMRSILGLGYLGAIPYAFKKPFEAWKQDREMILEMSGNQAAMMFVSSVPGLRDMDWANVLRGNTSQNIKNNIDKIAESIGGCYSVLRQDLINRYAHNYTHPHPKFIGALMATLAEYGNLYYSKNTKEFTPWFWYCKIRGIDPKNYKKLVEDRFTQQEAKILYYGDRDIAETAPDLTWAQLQKVNELNMTHQAFVCSEKKFPQYSNFYRMFQKYQSKSINKGAGESQLSEKNDEDRHDWMMKQVAGGRITEMVDGFGVWLEEEYYTSHFKLEPVMALFLSNRIAKAPVALTNQIRDMMKDKSILVPAFAFLDSAQDLDLFRRSSVEIAYMIGNDAGEELQKVIEDFDKAGGSNDIKKQMGGFSKFWKTYGEEMIDLMSVMKDPRILIAAEQEQGGDSPLNDLPPVTNSASGKYKGNLSNFLEKVTSKLGEENTIAIRSRQYKTDSFRVNSDRGFAPIILDLPNWFDKNFEQAFANGDNSIDGDGVWGELMKIIRNIPEYARKHAEAMGKGDDQKVIDAIAYTYFTQMRDGSVSKNGGIRDGILKSNLFTQNILRAPYWTRDAIIFDLAGPPETVAPRDGFTEWLQNRILVSQKVAAAYEAGGEDIKTTEEITKETQTSTDDILEFYTLDREKKRSTETSESTIPTEVEKMTEKQKNGGQPSFNKYIIDQAYLLTGQPKRYTTEEAERTEKAEEDFPTTSKNYRG